MKASCGQPGCLSETKELKARDLIARLWFAGHNGGNLSQEQGEVIELPDHGRWMIFAEDGALILALCRSSRVRHMTSDVRVLKVWSLLAGNRRE